MSQSVGFRLCSVLCASYEDITTLVNLKCVECLNEDRRYPHDNLFRGDERMMLQSDLDPQLLLTIPFTSTVKVHSIKLRAPTDDSSAFRAMYL